MSFEPIGLDLNEALRTLDLVRSDNNPLDIVMQVKGARVGQIEGESDRVFEDGKPRMEVTGYYFAALSPTDQGTGQSTGKRRYSSLRVVRQTDAATASMLSMFATNDNITVELATYKAGGDALTKNTQPILRINLKAARIRTYTLLGGGAVGGAVEIVEFTFRELEINSAPQQGSGKRGAVRTFADSLADGV